MSNQSITPAGAGQVPTKKPHHEKGQKAHAEEVVTPDHGAQIFYVTFERSPRKRNQNSSRKKSSRNGPRTKPKSKRQPPLYHDGKRINRANFPSEYASWESAKRRTLKPAPKDGPGYAGLAWPERWERFAGFFRDLGPKPDPSFTLDRRNPKKGYGPANCRWASPAQQTENRISTVRAEHKGVLLTLTRWAEVYDIPYATLYNRYRQGLRGPDLFKKPARPRPSEHRLRSSRLPRSVPDRPSSLPGAPAPVSEEEYDQAVAEYNRKLGEPEGLRCFRITAEEQQYTDRLKAEARDRALETLRAWRKREVRRLLLSTCSVPGMFDRPPFTCEHLLAAETPEELRAMVRDEVREAATGASSEEAFRRDKHFEVWFGVLGRGEMHDIMAEVQPTWSASRRRTAA